MSIKLFNYQQKCVDFIKSNHGLILYHSMGSGKTITSLSMATQFNNDIVIVATKSSKKNFVDDILKLGLSAHQQKKITLVSYQRAIMNIEAGILDFKNKVVIIDEAHRLRNKSKSLKLIIDECKKCHKIILLTGTIFVNSVADVAVLVNIVKNEHVMLEAQKPYKYYIDPKFDIHKEEEQLVESVPKTISYHKQPESEFFPKSKIFINKIPMNTAQLDAYKKYIVNIIPQDDKPVTTNDLLNIDFYKLEMKSRNFFLNATRQLSNTINGSIDSPKIRAIIRTILSAPKPLIVYSNFLKNGVMPIANYLNTTVIPFALYHGGLTEVQQRDIIVKYNAGTIDILLITTAGSESLDLKGTRQIHIMEPHWHESKIKQIVGRAIRYKSHHHLPIADRSVEIYRWISTFPKTIKYVSADEYIVNRAIKKEALFMYYDLILKKMSI